MSENRIYELSYLIPGSLAPEQAAAFAVDLRGRVERLGGVFISEDSPRQIPLAYPMEKSIKGKGQKFDEAYFGWLKFEQDPAEQEKLKKEMDELPEIIRYIIIKTVRESTIARRRYVPRRREEPKMAEVPAASTEEIDKRIEELVV